MLPYANVPVKTSLKRFDVGNKMRRINSVLSVTDTQRITKLVVLI